MFEIAIIAFGSNLPFEGFETSEQVLDAALERVADLATCGQIQVSSYYRSDPFPPSDQPKYINGVALLEWDAHPAALLAHLLDIERSFGRQRSVPNAARPLDLDLVACGGQVIESEFLTLPHPRMHDRGFVLGPLCEIYPAWKHPSLELRADELLKNCDQTGLVRLSS